eukprot:TRINITY_DN12471_c2_g1_i1.p1 TRINITY_DN12471_c2_g1~~TRINITY_DN12471_c2_g1_i1.p1  ORF type:complete len:433 (-),score=100.50 TRINITY_DN12471_c2_g1_i1:618-1916(-)
MSVEEGPVSLTAWFHPNTNLPDPIREIDLSKKPFPTQPEWTVNDLMEYVEQWIEQTCDSQGVQVQFQIQVLWNFRNSKKALNPMDNIMKHFKNGDTFGCFGDCVEIPAPKIPDKDKLPVTILTGFLGSGKTTLLNYILQEQQEKKIAVVENEFGEVSIDDALLKQDKLALAEKVVIMNNGCICCTVRGDLLEGLRGIIDDIKKKQIHIDQIMIETTGMADPVPIIRTFMATDDISATLRLDGVITVADAKHIIARLDDKVEDGKVNEAYQQVAFCDKMILNKLDLVTPEQAIEVRDRLRSINSFAKILPAVKSRVKMSELSNLRCHDMTNFINEAIEKEAENAEFSLELCEPAGKRSFPWSGGNLGDSAAKKSRHDSAVNSMAFVKEGEMIMSKMSNFSNFWERFQRIMEPSSESKASSLSKVTPTSMFSMR